MESQGEQRRVWSEATNRDGDGGPGRSRVGNGGIENKIASNFY